MVARALLNNYKNNKFPLNKLWSATQFNLNNPTALNYTIDLFNAYTLTNVSTVYTPIVTPLIVTATINFGAGICQNLAYNSTDNTMYYVDSSSNTVKVVDCTTNLVISTIFPFSPYSLAYNPLNNSIYVVDAFTGISIIDCSTNTVSGTIPVNVNSINIVYNSVDNRMYVTDATNSAIYVVDCVTNTVVATINAVLSTTNYDSIAYNPIDNTVYVVRAASSYCLINCNTNTVVGNFTIPTSSTLVTIQYNSSNNSMYVSDFSTGTVYIIDCASNSVLASTIPVGGNTLGMAYNPLKNTMYICDATSYNVSVIDCSTNTVTSIIATTSDVQFLAYNSINNSIYTANYSANSSTVISPSIIAAFSITGSTDYNQFVREFSFMPKRVRHITMIVDNQNQINIPYEMLTRDANGEQCTVPKLPNVSKNVNQYQSNMVELAFGEKELILDNTTTFNQYTVLPYSEVKMVIYYDEIDLSDALTNSVSVCQMIEPTVADGSSRTEAELEAKENLPLLDLQAIKSLKARDFIK